MPPIHTQEQSQPPILVVRVEALKKWKINHGGETGNS